ncbi:hypothetical protein DCPSUM001_08290 [Dysgonomonas capnocytophagoides]|nr:hypothetical protein DCPSUM001_08290 [Dysgonomonas capnocytophagoides]
MQDAAKIDLIYRKKILKNKNTFDLRKNNYIYTLNERRQTILNYMKAKNIQKVFVISGFISSIAMFSCSSNGSQVPAKDNQIVSARDTMKLNLDFTSVDTIKILYTANEETQSRIKEEETKAHIERILGTFVNDTAWNNSGIMVKMVAPDYMLVLHHAEESGLTDNWVSIWKELGKAKVEDKWYVLPNSKGELFALLDTLKYKR